jgi:hypothetical protein
MKGDQVIERGATLLEELSQRAALEGGVVAKLSEPLAEDAAFLRKLKPSLVSARLRGRPSMDGPPPLAVVPAAPPTAPSRPRERKGARGLNPLLVAGAAFALGVLVAKFVDWRGHAHPRD